MRRFFYYIFILFVFIAIPLVLGGIYVADYGSVINSPLWVDGFTPSWSTDGWYNITPFQNNFFLVFNDVNTQLQKFTITIPSIPTIPPMSSATGFLVIIDLLINFINGLVQFLNVLITLSNTLSATINAIFAFLTTCNAFILNIAPR